MAHIEPEDVDAAVDELAYHFGRFGSWAEGYDEFGFAGHWEVVCYWMKSRGCAGVWMCKIPGVASLSEGVETKSVG
jgi:hypothetical protein